MQFNCKKAVLSALTTAMACAAFMVLVAMGPSARADDMTGPDKVAHMAGSAGIALVTTSVTKSERTGFWTAVAIGAAKEVWDDHHRAQGHGPSWGDFAADVAGAYVGSRLGANVIIRRNGIAVRATF